MNCESKFTPGPWHILVPKPRYGNRECHSIVDSGGEYVAKTVVVSVLRGISAVKREERKANEHLIAAAPDMYVSLKDMVLTVTDLLEAISSGEENTDCLFAVVYDEIDNAIQVLQKARG